MDECYLNNIITEQLLNNLFEGILFVSTDKNILFMNRKAEIITGHLFKEVKNHPYKEILKHHTNKIEKIQKYLFPLDLALEKHSITKGSMLIYNKNGQKIPIVANVIPVFDKNNVIIGAIEYFITDSPYEQIEEANEILSNINKQKTEYLGMAAHDLKTPLTAIQGFNSFLLNINTENLSFDQISLLNRIENNCIKMSKIINYFLDQSTLSLKPIELFIEKIKIEDILDIKNFSFFDLLKKKDIYLIINIENNIPQIEVDKFKIIQVIENLVINSIKFSEAKTTIIIKARRKGDNIVISIKDEGLGIPKDHLDSIFEAFSTSTKPTGEEKSTGLGLLIVKKLVELHQGKIEVSSTIGSGSIFTITLPIKYTHTNK